MKKIKRARRLSRNVGRPPGTLVRDPMAAPTKISVIAYKKGELVETTWKNEKEVKKLQQEYPVLWINVVGLGDIEALKQLGQAFGMHPLALEDVVNTHQRPKLEEYKQDVFWVARLPHYLRAKPSAGKGDEEHEELLSSQMPDSGVDIRFSQISVYFGDGFVLSFNEEPNEVYESIRDRLRNAGGRIRGGGADYLTYALMDAVVDQYYPALDSLSEKIEILEEIVVSKPSKSTVREIYNTKRRLMLLRRNVWPLREVFGKLLTQNLGRFNNETKIYLRDVSDHVYGVLNLLEYYRELGTGLLEVYLSSNGNRMNEIMKVLTMIATVFLPLSFIAGVYGMNFKGEKSPFNMPELDWYFGYPFAIGLMLLVSAAFFVFFKKKGWLNEPEISPPPGDGDSASEKQ